MAERRGPGRGRRRSGRLTFALALVAVLGVVAGCSGDDGGAAPAPEGSSTSQPPSSSTTLDQSPFCRNVRSLATLGDGQQAGGPAAVVAQSKAMVGLLDEIAASVPEGAPMDVEALLDDYRAIAEAVIAAGGDTAVGYTALQQGQPELFARLSDPTAHAGAFRFFANRCGTPVP